MTWDEIIEDFAETEDHKRVRDSIRQALGDWRRFIVAIDGVDASGKSTLARYLAWKLRMPAIETDLFLNPNVTGLHYRLDDLKRLLHARLDRKRPLIVEGVRILRLLEQVGLRHDHLVYTEQVGHTGSHYLSGPLSAYDEQFKPRSKANQIFTWHLHEEDGRG